MRPNCLESESGMYWFRYLCQVPPSEVSSWAFLHIPLFPPLATSHCTDGAIAPCLCGDSALYLESTSSPEIRAPFNPAQKYFPIARPFLFPSLIPNQHAILWVPVVHNPTIYCAPVSASFSALNHELSDDLTHLCVTRASTMDCQIIGIYQFID